MGDRANLVVSRFPVNTGRLKATLPGTIVFYTHWGGYDLGPNLVEALKAASGRGADYSYVTRIIISRMIGRHWDGDSGHGLTSGELGDNERPVLLVDLFDRRVLRFGKGGYVSPEEALEASVTGQWSIDEFAAMDTAQARSAHLD
jgi:hypothetical protein